MSLHCAPLATYRLQFNADFKFEDAIRILDYLRDLGISHVYASPILTSRHGSNHGYDVTDPSRIDPEIGGEEGFAAFQAALEERGMGLLLDIVPNHMAASSENRWWMDVLEHGPDSPYAFYFDIDWHPPSRILENRLLLPFLAKPFGEAIEGGELQLKCESGRFLLQYGEQTFPVAPAWYAEILRYGETETRSNANGDSPAVQEWKGIIAVADSIATDHNSGTHAAAERRGKFEQMRERLRQLVASSPEMAAVLDSTLRSLNGKAGEPQTFNPLERILAGQFYRLAFWQTPSESINYRRFFSITDLVGVRVEDPAVFEATHEAIIRLGYKPCSTGFRVDHIDGLRDPAGYLRRLCERLAPGSTTSGAEHPSERPYIVVEKILGTDESLPEDWPVEGTTGYDYLNFANRVLVDEEQAAALEEVYKRWTGTKQDFADVIYEKKRLVMRTILGVEMRALGRMLADLARADRYARELEPGELMEALVEVTACLPVYRTYVQTLDLPEAPQKIVPAAIEAARKRRPNLPVACFNFVSDVLLLAAPAHTRPEQREARVAFVTRWQQLTGPVVAKGFEDTALYVYFPLASLNEVGGDPRVASAKPCRFHEFIVERQTHWPNSMNATTTHDTKRSEDNRARIAVLSEIPAEWESALMKWSAINEKFVQAQNGTRMPDKNEEYLFYQTLIGAWPICEDEWSNLVPRLQEYVIKATREAMIHTRWTRPNEAHESALREFVAGVVDRKANGEFCSSFDRFQQRTALYGMLNGLGQVVLKAVAPGVPDFYQGSDLWDLRLVDPDNRGPIDFDARMARLAALRNAPSSDCPAYIQELLDHWRDARVKMHVMTKALAARHDHRELFQSGNYRRLNASGMQARRVMAFARSNDGEWAIAAVPRCVASVDAPVADGDRREFWRKTSIELPEDAPKRWTNILAGGQGAIQAADGALTLGEAFADFPVAILLPA